MMASGVRARRACLMTAYTGCKWFGQQQAKLELDSDIIITTVNGCSCVSMCGTKFSEEEVEFSYSSFTLPKLVIYCNIYFGDLIKVGAN